MLFALFAQAAPPTQVVGDPTSITWWAEHFGVFGVMLFLGTPLAVKVLYWLKSFLESIRDAHVKYLADTSGTIGSNTSSIKTLADANIAEIKLMEVIAQTQGKHTDKLEDIHQRVQFLTPSMMVPK